MTSSQHPTCELIAGYALGALTSDEYEEFSQHLRNGCLRCEADLPSLQAAVADLAISAPRHSPPPTLRDRVMARMAEETTTSEPSLLEKDGLLFARSGRIEWMTLIPDQIQIKPLSVDPQRGLSTQLVRMSPGATYPSHRHAGVEELFLLEGDLEVSGVKMRAGDYCRAEVGSLHIGITSHTGSVFISTNSIYDEAVD